jgi:hypothetical protein
MSDSICTLQGRDDLIVAYLYDDLDARARLEFTTHVNGCEACREELDELVEVRASLAQWTPPEPAKVLAFNPAPPRRGRLSLALGETPVWAQAAAALLVLAVSIAVANVHVRYDAEGVTVSTGWLSAPDPGTGAPAALQDAVSNTAAEAPWRVDLAAVERALRGELEAIKAAPAQDGVRLAGAPVPRPGADATGVAVVDDAAVMRRVRAMIEESERRQQTELAFRVAEVTRDVQSQRNADLQRIQRTFAVFENTTGGEMVRQRQLLNNLAVRVSQQP